jgi:proline iminopeptidase
VPARRPRFTHHYLDSLDAPAEHRPVIFYDQLGCGRSDRPENDTLWNVNRFVEELAQVRSVLHLDRLHLFGSSWAACWPCSTSWTAGRTWRA